MIFKLFKHKIFKHSYAPIIMQNISKEELKTEKLIFFNKIKQGALFIHPTDTIYGIGCNATNHNSVYNVREAKERYTAPFSVIVPSKDWIRENCEVNEAAEKWINKLPGPYTLILKLKNKDGIAPNVNMDMDTLGVRIPDHWFSEIVTDLGIPIVTTSANITQDDFMTSEDNLHPKVTCLANITNGTAPLTVSFNCLAYDPDGSIINYHWDFDDNKTHYILNTTHVFEKAGTYHVVLTVTDNNGAICTTTKIITISQ